MKEILLHDRKKFYQLQFINFNYFINFFESIPSNI